MRVPMNNSVLESADMVEMQFGSQRDRGSLIPRFRDPPNRDLVNTRSGYQAMLPNSPELRITVLLHH